jgi:hypothetical protein
MSYTPMSYMPMNYTPIAVGKSSELDKRVLWEKSTDITEQTEGRLFV